ncbi:hypothetical protein C8R44DRAFT_976121 [Mycena epipterygia]|nr:hypothetical protein C8R44DRAFT_976121 [Mycena epipterygia]
MSFSRPLALELPYELTSQIFIHCLPLHRRVRPGRKRAPLQLAQICGQWRAVALATPELWSSIYLEFPTGGPYDGIPMLLGIPSVEPVQDHTCDLLELWLARAADYPLSITLICPDRHTRLPERLLDLVAVSSAHWARVELQVSIADFLHFDRIQGPFPSLRSLGIRITDYAGAFPRVNAIREAPELRTVNLMDEFSGLAPQAVQLLPASATALQSVTIRQADPLEELHHILEQFPHLRHLRIYYEGPSNHPMATARKLVLHLQSLLLRSRAVFLDFVDIPTLEHLEVGLGWISWRNDIAPIPAFLTCSARHLNHLTLDIEYILGCDLMECIDALIPCLEAVPTLTTLELVLPNASVHAARYQFLLSATLLPHLRTLIITDTLRVGTYAPFLAMLRARPALVHAELHLRPRHWELSRRLAPPGHDIVAGFEALVAEGLNIRVTTPTYVWPCDSRDDDAPENLDYDVFGSMKTRSCFFSPF